MTTVFILPRDAQTLDQAIDSWGLDEFPIPETSLSVDGDVYDVHWSHYDRDEDRVHVRVSES